MLSVSELYKYSLLPCIKIRYFSFNKMLFQSFSAISIFSIFCSIAELTKLLKIFKMLDA